MNCPGKLAISNGVETSSRMLPQGVLSLDVDSAIGRHGEPHVVRIRVHTPIIYQDILLVANTLDLREELHGVVARAPVSSPRVHTSMD